MSLTPGWKEEDNRIIEARHQPCDHPDIYATPKSYYLDNGSEYKRFPRTKEGWWDLCEALKEFEP